MSGTVQACCLFCKQEFAIRRRDTRRANLHHHCQRANTDYRSTKARKWYDANKRRPQTMASCLFCREEFPVIFRCQHNHGCADAQRDRRRTINKARNWSEIKKKKKPYHRSVRITDNLHLCPDCRVVMTANRFRCDACWQRKSTIYDTDVMIAVNEGYSRHIGRASI